MRRLRSFCGASVVLAVYHPDSADDPDAEAGGGEAPARGASGGEQTGQSGSGAGGVGTDELCEAGVGGFFDGVLEVQEGVVLPMRPCRAPVVR